MSSHPSVEALLRSDADALAHAAICSACAVILALGLRLGEDVRPAVHKKRRGRA